MNLSSVLTGSPFHFLVVNNRFLVLALPFSDKLILVGRSKMVSSSCDTTPIIVIRHFHGIIYWQSDACGFKDSFMNILHTTGSSTWSWRFLQPLKQRRQYANEIFDKHRNWRFFTFLSKLGAPVNLTYVSLLLGWNMARNSQIISTGRIVYSLLAIRSCSLFWPPLHIR